MNHTSGNDTTAMMIALVFVPRRSARRRVLWFRALAGLYEQGSEDGRQDADCRQHHRDDHGVNPVNFRDPC